jgi:hypothetical protein
MTIDSPEKGSGSYAGSGDPFLDRENRTSGRVVAVGDRDIPTLPLLVRLRAPQMSYKALNLLPKVI